MRKKKKEKFPEKIVLNRNNVIGIPQNVLSCVCAAKIDLFFCHSRPIVAGSCGVMRFIENVKRNVTPAALRLSAFIRTKARRTLQDL